ncbi:hypothetical protein [Paenibacillus sp. P36]|uniref:hypothetical protein n=1 Tax=Paenibacillus sp. P36 TaxID=3342538 RepID=UPI0038B319ED
MKSSVSAGKVTITHENKIYTSSSKSANVFRIQLTSIGLGISGILFVLYPAIRPFSDEASLSGAAAFASPEWLIAHVMAMLAFILLTFGLLGFYLFLQETYTDRLAFLGFVLSLLGTGLTLPFYGAEVFGLHAIGQEAIKLQNSDLIGMANVVRFGPGFTMILIGLLSLAIGCILTAIGIWKSRILPKWSGIPLALGFLLYIPQFVGTQPIRVAHGFVVAIGCLWMAVSLFRKSRLSQR